MSPEICKNGHKLTEANTYIRPNGWRNCRTCKQLRYQRWHASRPLLTSPSAIAARAVFERDQSEIDDVIVERILSGHGRDLAPTATRAERAEVIRRWRGGWAELDAATGWNLVREKRRALGKERAA